MSDNTSLKKIKLEENKPSTKPNISSILSSVKLKKQLLQSQLEQTKNPSNVSSTNSIEIKKQKEIEEKTELLKQKAQEISERLSKITQGKGSESKSSNIPPAFTGF